MRPEEQFDPLQFCLDCGAEITREYTLRMSLKCVCGKAFVGNTAPECLVCRCVHVPGPCEKAVRVVRRQEPQ